MPRRRRAGRATSAPTAPDTTTARTGPTRNRRRRLAHGEGTDAHERQLAQRDLTGIPDQQHERETDNAEGQPLRKRRERCLAHHGGQNDHDRDQQDGTSHLTGARRPPWAGPDRQASGGGQPRRGDHEQDHEEEGHRDDLDEDGGEAGVDVAREVALGVVGDQPEDDAPTKVMGRLRRRPTTAAANPFRASSVSWTDVNPVCPTSGAMSTPARATSMKPSTHPICDSR